MLRKKQLNLLAEQKLQDYIQSNQFPRDTIPDLLRLVRHIPQQIIKVHITSHLNIIQSIKWLILLHNLNFIQIKNKQTQIESLLQLINPTSMLTKPFDSILLQKLIKPYKAYILKRNTFNLSQIEPQFHCYALLNMLKVGLSFINIIFTLGRYLFKKYNFLVEFNLIMAKDLSYLYRVLKYKMKQEFQVQNLPIIELLNQRMYSVFYNCYFNKIVSHFVPDWIKTDIPQLAKKLRILNKSQVKTKKGVKSNRLDSEHDYQVSIEIDQSSLKIKDQVKSISTLASHRQTDFSEEIEPNKKQKEYKQRKEFIQMAESILKSIEDNYEEAH